MTSEESSKDPHPFPVASLAGGRDRDRWTTVAAWCAAALLLVAASGYSFMDGNHEVYLLAPLQLAGLADFSSDWFVSGTLQYHGLFSLLAAALFKLGIAKLGFFVGYVALLAGVVWAWHRIVVALGGTHLAFVVAVVGYHVLLGDRALGFYSLIQDGQFNAGNVAAVAFLLAIASFLTSGRWSPAAWIALAGLCHLNYAVVGAGAWVVFAAWMWRNDRLPVKQLLGPSALALVACVANIALALPAKLSAQGGMPLAEFVDLYVYFRHAHHYAPRTWPVVVWIAALLPVPLAILACRQSRREEPSHRDVWNRAGVVAMCLIGLQLVALVTAGLFYLSETFVQLSLWRLSPHLKLLLVSMAAIWLCSSKVGRAVGMMVIVLTTLGVVSLLILNKAGVAAAQSEVPIGNLALNFSIALCVCTMVAAVAIARESTDRERAAVVASLASSVALSAMLAAAFLAGLDLPGQRPADPTMLALADWAKRNTPARSIFLLPPGSGSSFGIHARRGQVVSFKLVPQLSGELAEWETRLQTVLGIDDLTTLTGNVNGYTQVQDAADAIYAERSLEALAGVARDYDADFLVTLQAADRVQASRLGLRVVHEMPEGVSVYVVDEQE